MARHLLIAVTILLGTVMIGRIVIEPERSDQSTLFTEPFEGSSVTFIMGSEEEGAGFYSNAAEHFSHNEVEKTDIVVRTCRTIGDVITYLNKSSLRGQQPWSIVNIVAHGNPNTGLSIDITESGHRATPRRLLQAVVRGDTPRLNRGVIDSTTKINFWSCGIGKSAMLNLALRRMFCTSDGGTADVYCSPHFVMFQPSGHDGITKRIKASYWPYYYRRGYRPSDSEIAQALAIQYPQEDLNWTAALNQQNYSDTTDVCYGEYHIPVRYIKVYAAKEDRPDFTSDEEKIAWALDQPAIRDQIEESGIPKDRFNWTIHKIKHKTDDGRWVPAVKAIGMATVLYVLRGE